MDAAQAVGRVVECDPRGYGGARAEGEQAGNDRSLPVAARSLGRPHARGCAGFGLTTGLGLTKGVGSAAVRCLQWGHDRHDRYRASY